MPQDPIVIPFASAPAFLIRVLIPRFACRKNRFESEVITLADRVILMVVAIGTTDSQTQHCLPKGGDLVCAPYILEHLRKAVERVLPWAQRPNRHRIRHLFRLFWPKFITGNLLQKKPIDRLIGGDASNDKIPIMRCLFIKDVRFETAGIRITHNIKPMPRPALGVGI